MATHQSPPLSVFRLCSELANEIFVDSSDHDLARHTLAWCDLEEGKVPTQLMDELLKKTRTSTGIPHHANLGWMLSQCLRSKEAVNRLHKDLDENPDSEDLKLFAAISLQRTRDFRTSEMVLEELLSKSPHNLSARQHYASALMTLGKWSEGFIELEKSRGDLTPLQTEFCRDISRLWMGQDIAGKHILVVGNDHLGDQIQFSRYINELRKLNPHKIGFTCSPELVGLMRSMKEINRVDSVLFRPYDYFVPVESLPWRLGASPENIPATPWLNCNPKKVAVKKKALSKGKPLLGICWRNHQLRSQNPDCIRYEQRANSIDLDLLKQYLPAWSETHDIISLQEDLRFDEREQLKQLGVTITDQNEFGDFESIAELIFGLDKFITVDSPVAHLAGALGAESHVLLPYVTDWKWSAEDGQSLWYPHFKIHRKRSERSWATCLSEVSEDLKLQDAFQKAS